MRKQEPRKGKKSEMRNKLMLNLIKKKFSCLKELNMLKRGRQ